MLQAFVITLREGLEAFLIVAISLAYLRKTGRRALIPAVRWGIVASIAPQHRRRRAARPGREPGAVGRGPGAGRGRPGGLADGAHVAGRPLHEAGHRGQARGSSTKTGTAAFLGVFVFTLLMITREGMETALLMNALLFQVRSLQIVARRRRPARLSPRSIAWLWSRYGHRVNLARFFQVTAVFLLVFVVQLLIYGFHELTEANIFPNSQPWHDATEPFGPDGIYGQYLTYLLVLLPLAWLAVANLFKREAPQRSQTA